MSSPDGTPTENRDVKTLHLAKWETRFGAWLIDVLLVGALVGFVGDFVGLVPNIGAPGIFTGTNGVVLFLYWTFLEGDSGQSVGKKVLDLRVTDRRGDDIDYATAALESFGKAFLLPLDCLVGWLAMPGEKLRLFNRISDTIVVEAEPDEVEGVEYVIPEE